MKKNYGFKYDLREDPDEMELEPDNGLTGFEDALTASWSSCVVAVLTLARLMSREDVDIYIYYKCLVSVSVRG